MNHNLSSIIPPDIAIILDTAENIQEDPFVRVIIKDIHDKASQFMVELKKYEDALYEDERTAARRNGMLLTYYEFLLTSNEELKRNIPHLQYLLQLEEVILKKAMTF